MFLSDAIANDKPHVDVYAIANSGSTGLTLTPTPDGAFWMPQP